MRSKIEPLGLAGKLYTALVTERAYIEVLYGHRVRGFQVSVLRDLVSESNAKVLTDVPYQHPFLQYDDSAPERAQLVS
jgi:hypothetical protein